MQDSHFSRETIKLDKFPIFQSFGGILRIVDSGYVHLPRNDSWVIEGGPAVVHETGDARDIRLYAAGVALFQYEDALLLQGEGGTFRNSHFSPHFFPQP